MCRARKSARENSNSFSCCQTKKERRALKEEVDADHYLNDCLIWTMIFWQGLFYAFLILLINKDKRLF